MPYVLDRKFYKTNDILEHNKYLSESAYLALDIDYS